MFADREEHRLGALIRKRFEHRRRVSGPGAVIESQNDFLVFKKIIRFEMLEPETGSAGGVDFDDACHTECFWIVALGGSCGRRSSLRVLGPGGGGRRHRDRQGDHQSTAHHVLHAK
jgi:hypothetical protein